MKDWKSSGPQKLKLDTNGEGSFESVFATLNVKDSDDDVTENGAFGEQEVVVSPWNHGAWERGTVGLPIGIGKIFERKDEAIIQGEFDLEDADGLRTYKKLKYLDGKGRRVEWSYALPHVESRLGEFEGQDVRFLEKIQVPEVSPVMLGAGVNTRLLSIKKRKDTMPNTDENRKPASTRFVDQLDETVETVERAISRTAKVSALSHEEGRQIGRRSLRRMKILRDALHEAESALDGILKESEAPETKKVTDPNDEFRALMQGVGEK